MGWEIPMLILTVVFTVTAFACFFWWLLSERPMIVPRSYLEFNRFFYDSQLKILAIPIRNYHGLNGLCEIFSHNPDGIHLEVVGTLQVFLLPHPRILRFGNGEIVFGSEKPLEILPNLNVKMRFPSST